MNLNDLPSIYELLKEQELIPISVIEGDKVICNTPNGEKYLLKDCRGTEEDVFTKVFPEIEALGLKFKTLLLPKYLRVITKEIGPDGKKRSHKFIFIKFYDGIYFNQSWNEVSPSGYGGRSVDLNLADKVIGLLEDLSLIDISNLSRFSLPTFDFNQWRSKNFLLLTQNLMQKDVITQDQIDRATAILSSTNIFQDSKMILTNGDFYPRNFIQTSEGKIVVIDWEGRIDYERYFIQLPNGNSIIVDENGKNSIELQFGAQIEKEKFAGQRNALINYLENHIAFFFVHMWGNYKLQRRFIRDVAKRFNISSVKLQAAFLIKSLEQALAFGGGYLTTRQLEIFVNSLDEDYVKDLMS